jgi:hypothetical protein
VDRELVQKIAQQVLAAMSGSAAAPSRAAPAQPRAEIHPPAGTCTGDYSKFPELAARLAPPAAPQAQPAPAAEPVALTGIITASQLRIAMDAAPDKVATLATDARLTPLAADLARQFPQRVRRVVPMASPGKDAGSAPGHASGGGAWAWWIEGQCSAVEEIVNARRARLRMVGASRSSASLDEVVRNVVGAIKGKQVVGGLLFVPSAARAVCMANRCAAIRAVVGTCGEAVEQGIRELGANVLVIEYPHVGPAAVAAMMDRIMAQAPKAPPQVERQLADLGRC